MGLETAAMLAIGSAVVGAAGSFASMGAARSSAQAQADAASDQAEFQYKEITRQQEQVNETAAEQKSDRMRKAAQELGTLRVLAGERGASGSTFTSLAQEIGYFEGLDLSRIDTNRKNNIASGEASKEAARMGAAQTVSIASNQAKVAGIAGGLNIVGSGLQIGSGYYGQQAQLNALKNQKVT
jgi:hypothetical protein